MKAPVVKVRWCAAGCGRELVMPEPGPCPKCGRPTADLGWRIGFHSGNFEYQSRPVVERRKT